MTQSKSKQDVIAKQPLGEVVVITNQLGHCVAVTRQDDEGRILSVIWEAKPQVKQTPVVWLVEVEGEAVAETYLGGKYGWDYWIDRSSGADVNDNAAWDNIDHTDLFI